MLLMTTKRHKKGLYKQPFLVSLLGQLNWPSHVDSALTR